MLSPLRHKQHMSNCHVQSVDGSIEVILPQKQQLQLSQLQRMTHCGRCMCIPDIYIVLSHTTASLSRSSEADLGCAI